MLVSTLQMSGADALQDYFPPVSCNGKLLERVTTATILGFHMDKHLTRVDHVTALLSSWYAALAVLRKWHNLAPYHVYIYAKQFNSGVISDVKTGLRVGHLVSPPSLSNEMAANRVQTTCTGLYLSGRILFLRTSKNWTGYPLLKGETWHCWNPFLKPFYDVAWPDYLRLKFHTVIAYKHQSWLFQLKAALFRTRQRDCF